MGKYNLEIGHNLEQLTTSDYSELQAKGLDIMSFTVQILHN